jgi:hypothetical protein
MSASLLAARFSVGRFQIACRAPVKRATGDGTSSERGDGVTWQPVAHITGSGSAGAKRPAAGVVPGALRTLQGCSFPATNVRLHEHEHRHLRDDLQRIRTILGGSSRSPQALDRPF